MPLLTRMVGTPLDDRHRAGSGRRARAAARRPPDLQRRPRGRRRRARGWARRSRRRCARSSPTPRSGPSRAARVEAARRPRDAAARQGFYDALVGIGGGRTLDVAKYAASLGGLPVVAVATSLAHDGIASPVASLEDEAGRKASYGVQMPIAVVVDLDYVRRSEPAMRRSGIGDAISNLSAIADWRLAERERGEAVDGVAVTFARTAATSAPAPRGRDRRRRRS